MPAIRPFGAWPSPVGADDLAEAKSAFAFPQSKGGARFWLEARPKEGGRLALMRMDAAGAVAEWPKRATPFNARTSLHEYGGRPYLALAADDVVAVDFADQRIWRLRGGEAAPITPEPARPRALRYADFVHDQARGRLIAIEEDHGDGGEPNNRLVALDLDGGGRMVIDDDHDFVAAPALSPDGSRLAWIAWNHPDMPWDETVLRVADLDERGAILAARALETGASLLQPMFGPEGDLYFFSDRSGYWAPWRAPIASGGETAALLDIARDVAGPLWAVGERWGQIADGRGLLIAEPVQGRDQLTLLALDDGALIRRYDLPFARFQTMSVEDGVALTLAGSPRAPTCVLEIDLESGAARAIAQAPPPSLAAEAIAEAEAFSYESGAGRVAHAYFYAPKSATHEGPSDAKPPLIVKIHGGPTGAASPNFDLRKQYWTSRGFALVDVDYAGSTGYGRAYREALRGQWGVADVEDCIRAAKALAARGVVDPERLLITGGSAGGFTTLMALATSDAFAAGCSAYGVADLEALARDTHKFESRYLDRLIGPYPERRDLYVARSPISHVDDLKSPLVVLQGLDDKVVPPNQAEMIVAALRKKKVPVAYVPFAGEGHGFRKAENVVAALEAELAFYRAILRIEAEERLAPLEIDWG